VKEYPELLRIKSDHIEKRGDKRYVEVGWLRSFLKGRKRLIIEEKLDGSQMAIGWKNGSAYIQGRRSHISRFDARPEYNGVLEWVEARDAELKPLRGYLVFGEWLKVRHHVAYESLPDWFIAFDVWDSRSKRFLPLRKKAYFLDELGIESAPVLHEGKVSITLIDELAGSCAPSRFSDEVMEGFLIKDYDRQDFLKCVIRDFEEEDSIWTSAERQVLNDCSPESTS
jgi:ATP-dependent RNA circularization protein (DNA/RNA ligase family)